MKAQAAAVLVAAAMLAGCVSDIPGEEIEKRYATSASQFLKLKDGTRLHYHDEGPRDGQVVMLLHGSNDSLFTWNAWSAALSDRYRVIRFDFPGHGLTGPTPVADYTAARYAAVITEVADALGLARFALGGNSMGGAMSWYYAAENPQRVRALILANAAGYPREGGPPAVFVLASLPVLGDLFSSMTNRDMIERNLKTVIADDRLVTPALVDRYTDLLLREGNRGATLKRFRTPPEDPEVWRRIATISAPTLVLWGDQDPWIPVGDAARFGQDIKGARVIVYTGVGHVPQEETPQQSASDVRAFLDGLGLAPVP
jgi:pimeloyl-ACP methyl ester carboxylesterase